MPKLDLSNVEGQSFPETPKGPINWSEQQIAVFDHVKDVNAGSALGEAVAGSGKTTTAKEAASYMKGRVGFGAYNKRIADEIKLGVRHLPNVNAGTMHGFGFAQWRNVAPDAEVNKDKLEALCEEHAVPFNIRQFTKFMVSLAKQAAYKTPVSMKDWSQMAEHHDALDKLPESWNEDRDPFEYCNFILQASIDSAESIIDFDDMLYMPIITGKIRSEFDHFIIDEAQDTNYARRKLVEGLIKDSGRVLAIGDRHQAIYGFTGADADALDIISNTFEAKYLPLTVTYRCPKKVVEHARQWVSHITAADSAPEGSLVQGVSEFDLPRWGLSGRDAIICRLNKPTVTLALSLIRQGIGARVEGRDIGQSLITVVNKFKGINNLSELYDKVKDWTEKEYWKYIGKGNEVKARQQQDKGETLLAVIESLPITDSIYSLRSRITSLFGDTDPGQTPKVVTLSSVHKAKGREWDRVFLLGREQLMPSQWARQEWQQEQEKNLIYVAVTRAKKELVEVDYFG